MTKRRARYIGCGAILVAIAVQLFNDLACYGNTFSKALIFLWFPAIPLLPAFVSLGSKNPLRALGASAVVIPWYAFAYYTDCVVPYQGGGASMIYVAVIFWGFPSAVLGALLTGPICRGLGITIEDVDKTRGPTRVV